MKIAGHTFLVSGGASGLGLACVRRLCRQNGRVLILDRDSSTQARLTSEFGSAVRVVSADVTDEEQVQVAVNEAVSLSEGAGLRGAINCAGIVSGERVLGKDSVHSLKSFTHMIQVNLIGTFNVSRLACDAIAKGAPDENGERGVIINTSSVAAFEGQIGQAAYAASKGGVASMSLPMARELAQHGIRVVAIAPGVFETPMVAALPDKVRTSLQNQTVFPSRLGLPDEFAALVGHIIENPMLNGCVLRLDGASRIGAR